MAFQVSPGVQVTEKDLTNVVPAVATSIAGIVMAAQKGPTDSITAISSEEELVSIFGEPQSTNNQFEDWMSAAAFGHMATFKLLPHAPAVLAAHCPIFADPSL